MNILLTPIYHYKIEDSKKVVKDYFRGVINYLRKIWRELVFVWKYNP